VPLAAEVAQEGERAAAQKRGRDIRE